MPNYRVRFRDGRETRVPAEIVRQTPSDVVFYDLGAGASLFRTVAIYARLGVVSIEAEDVFETRCVVADIEPPSTIGRPTERVAHGSGRWISAVEVQERLFREHFPEQAKLLDVYIE